MDQHNSAQPSTNVYGQNVRDRAFKFACRAVSFCQVLYDGGGIGRMMVKQILDASLTFDTSLEEAKAAESDADFISKCSIGLKELREAWARVRVCVECEIGPEKDGRWLVQESNELISIVTTIIRNKRRNAAGRLKPPRRGSARSYTFTVAEAGNPTSKPDTHS
jgi:four helix bundle protein